MRIVVHGRNVEVAPRVRQYLQRKLSKVEKLLGTRLTHPAQANFSTERERYIVEVTLPIDGMLLRGEEGSENFLASIDRVVEKLEKQVVKYKTRLLKRIQRAGGKPWEEAAAAEAAAEEDGPRIVRVKRFPLKPITPEEAVMEMTLLGHDFYVFINAETDAVNVVYRRKDGNFGHIAPEL